MISRARARVLVVGVGGLGCPALMALAHAGIGTIGIVDDDDVDITNLHRQILFDENDVGAPKLEVAARALKKRVPSLHVDVHATRLLPENAVAIASSYDVVLEGADNFATKFLAADACAIAGVPIVHAASVRWHGTVLAVVPSGTRRACYRCVFEDLPRENAPNCAEAGVIGPVVGVVGALQADLALGIVDGRDVAGQLVTFDGLTGALRRRTVASREGCALCGSARSIRSIEANRYVDAGACEGV